jgi:hypothetical protein
MRVRIEPPIRPLPVLRWKWDEETDILSGVAPAPVDARGLSTSVEITDEAGTVIVVDVTRGLLCGLDMVVWPDVEVDPDVRMPDDVPEGTLCITTDDDEPAPAVEIAGQIAVHASVDESLYHVRLGIAEVVRRLRVAQHLVVELDADGDLAGFWLSAVPPYIPPDDEDF